MQVKPNVAFVTFLLFSFSRRQNYNHRYELADLGGAAIACPPTKPNSHLDIYLRQKVSPPPMGNDESAIVVVIFMNSLDLWIDFWLIWYSTKRAYVIMICPSCIVVVRHWHWHLCTALLATGFRIETSYLV